jgi:hypothetical protein
MANTGKRRESARIESLEDARQQVGFIVAQINSNPKLAIAAAANPLFALEDLGYEVTPEAQVEIADHVRFGATTAARLKRLRTMIHKAAGRTFDLESDQSLREVLEQLEVRLGQAGSPRHAKRKPETSPVFSLARSPQLKWTSKEDDPLEVFRGRHPVMDALLEYRQIESSEPRLATRALYDEIRQGSRRTPLVSVRVVLRTRGK